MRWVTLRHRLAGFFVFPCFGRVSWWETSVPVPRTVDTVPGAAPAMDCQTAGGGGSSRSLRGIHRALPLGRQVGSGFRGRPQTPAFLHDSWRAIWSTEYTRLRAPLNTHLSKGTLAGTRGRVGQLCGGSTTPPPAKGRRQSEPALGCHAMSPCLHVSSLRALGSGAWHLLLV